MNQGGGGDRAGQREARKETQPGAHVSAFVQQRGETASVSQSDSLVTKALITSKHSEARILQNQPGDPAGNELFSQSVFAV